MAKLYRIIKIFVRYTMKFDIKLRIKTIKIIYHVDQYIFLKTVFDSIEEANIDIICIVKKIFI